MIEFLFIVLGVAVGYNLRREWQQYKENLDRKSTRLNSSH